MKSEFTIGRILRPRGIKGVVKAETYTDNPSRFQNLKEIKIDGKAYALESFSREGEFCYFKLAGVDTPEAAEALRDKLITTNRDQLPKPPKDRYYIVDMLGIDVFVAGNRLGELVDILQYGTADVYVVRTDKGTVSFPAIAQLIKSVDLEKGTMILDDMVFDRTAVYN